MGLDLMKIPTSLGMEWTGQYFVKSAFSAYLDFP